MSALEHQPGDSRDPGQGTSVGALCGLAALREVVTSSRETTGGRTTGLTPRRKDAKEDVSRGATEQVSNRSSRARVAPPWAPTRRALVRTSPRGRGNSARGGARQTMRRHPPLLQPHLPPSACILAHRSAASVAPVAKGGRMLERTERVERLWTILEEFEVSW